MEEQRDSNSDHTDQVKRKRQNKEEQLINKQVILFDNEYNNNATLRKSNPRFREHHNFTRIKM